MYNPEFRYLIARDNGEMEPFINTDNLILIVKKDNKPDVYHIYDNNNNLIHFASIPDTITSQLCYEGLKNVDSAMFKYVMCPKWKRYKPIELVKIEKNNLIN
jgi:hypothetical protein